MFFCVKVYLITSMKKYSLTIFIISFLLSSCNEDITASWLKIEKIDLNTNITTEGENTNDISDAWVYMDNQPLGVWELPCEIPILAEGEHDFIIYAGIKSNGINATRIRYPFYKPVEFSLSLSKGQTVEYTPAVYYKDNLSFVAREDFEDTGIILNPNANDTSKLQIISKINYPDIVEYGNNCGEMTLTSIDSVVQVFTDLTLDLPVGQIFMELDYMNTNSLAVGIISQTASTFTVSDPFILINTQEESTMQWKKIYLDLTEYISYVQNPVYFEYYIVSVLDANKTGGNVYLDNIKIVHYN
jgi:hypothetical protein